MIYGNLYRTKTFCVLIQKGLGDSKGERRRERELGFPPLAGFFGIFLVPARKIPAGGISTTGFESGAKFREIATTSLRTGFAMTEE